MGGRGGEAGRGVLGCVPVKDAAVVRVIQRRTGRKGLWWRRSAAAVSLGMVGFAGGGCEAAGAAGAAVTADKAAGAAVGVAAATVEATAMLIGATGELLLDIVTLGNNGETNQPTGELTLEEGRKLVSDIQKNPNRINTLTDRERRFLAKATAAANNNKERRRR